MVDNPPMLPVSLTAISVITSCGLAVSHMPYKQEKASVNNKQMCQRRYTWK